MRLTKDRRKKIDGAKVKPSNRVFSLSNAILCDFPALTSSSAAILPFLFFQATSGDTRHDNASVFIMIGAETARVSSEQRARSLGMSVCTASLAVEQTAVCVIDFAQCICGHLKV